MSLLRERVPLTLLVDLAGLGGTSEDVYRREIAELLQSDALVEQAS